eukprot:10538753-Heterocapsa_arctica.AAC.1
MGYVAASYTRQASHQHSTVLSCYFIRAVRRDLADLHPRLLQVCWSTWLTHDRACQGPTVEQCHIFHWDDTTEHARSMEWDQRTLDLVTSQRVRINHDILVTGTGQIPPWTTWYSHPPNLSRDTAP